MRTEPTDPAALEVDGPVLAATSLWGEDEIERLQTREAGEERCQLLWAHGETGVLGVAVVAVEGRGRLTAVAASAHLVFDRDVLQLAETRAHTVGVHEGRNELEHRIPDHPSGPVADGDLEAYQVVFSVDSIGDLNAEGLRRESSKRYGLLGGLADAAEPGNPAIR